MQVKKESEHFLTTHCPGPVPVNTSISPFIHPLSQVSELDGAPTNREGLAFKPSLFGSKACTYPLHQTSAEELRASKSQTSKVRTLIQPRWECTWSCDHLCFLSGCIAVCCCRLEVGRQEDSRDPWKGRMDEKVFQRRSLCPPLILWASSGKQSPTVREFNSIQRHLARCMCTHRKCCCESQ